MSKKLVFVTGAGRGIGRAIAVKLVEAGFEVSGCARSMNELTESRNLTSGKMSVATVDVCDQSSVENWMKSELRSGIEPWGLVTAAGIYGPIGSFTENSMEEWKKSIEVNLYGTLYPVHFFARTLIATKRPGRIVLLSGGGATQPLPNFTSYCAAKSAVVRFGETLALELAPHGVSVNSIAPGAINTKFVDDVVAAGPSKAGEAMYQKAVEMKAKGGTTPDKASALVEYLMSDASAKVSGKLISAVWDPWSNMHEEFQRIDKTDIYTLRRIVPEDRPNLKN